MTSRTSAASICAGPPANVLAHNSSAFSATRASPLARLTKTGQCVRGYCDALTAQSSFGIVDCSLYDSGDILIRKCAQHIDTTSGQQGRYHLERRILSGGSDQPDGAVLDVGKNGVLLGFIESVYLVDEENCTLPGQLQAIPGFFHYLAQVCHTCRYRADLHEYLTGSACQGAGQRRLPLPGGPQKMSDPGSPPSMARRKGRSWPRRSRWPMISSRLRGRMRAANGADASRFSSPAENKVFILRKVPRLAFRRVVRRLSSDSLFPVDWGRRIQRSAPPSIGVSKAPA